MIHYMGQLGATFHLINENTVIAYECINTPEEGQSKYVVSGWEVF